ncbi:short-chain dehydrogenase/reductase SDR [Hyaloraphidium curvatum]|nr:short-chain dehydrogenase/reductase SDR [Hyaloraphidium curvatum]
MAIVALITGGSEGIGLATAVKLASQGAEVAIAGRTKEKLEKAAALIKSKTGKDALQVQADVRRKDECERAVAETVARFGGITYLVNNAGTSAARPFESVTDEQWDDDLDLKVKAAIRCTRAALPHLKKAKGASIVSVLAIAGKAPGASSVPTSVSRAAGLALTKALSRDLGPHGIRVNAVCIGLVRSAQVERMAAGSGKSYEEWSAGFAKTANIPLGRVGESEEAADAIVYLLGPSSSYVTGVAVNLDGGMSPVL